MADAGVSWCRSPLPADNGPVGAYTGVMRLLSVTLMVALGVIVLVGCPIAVVGPDVAVDDARFIAQEVPATVQPGAGFPARFTLENVGTTTWSAGDGIQLVVDADDVWSVASIALPPEARVGPGATGSFEAVLTAPSTPGRYRMQWRLVREDGPPFGDPTNAADVDVDVDVVAPPGPGAVTVTAPAFAMAHDAGDDALDGLHVIVDPTITITIAAPEQVATVTLQRSPLVEPPVWSDEATFAAPTSTTITSPLPFATAGAFLVRAVVTGVDGLPLESAPAPIEALSFELVASADTTLPIVGATVTLTATMSPSAPAAFPNTPLGWLLDRGGAGRVEQGTTNPIRSTVVDATPQDWLWVETFPDGSRLFSTIVRVSPQPAPPVEVVVADGTCVDLQQGLNQAAAAGLPLRLTGTFTVDCRVRIPSDVDVDATAATFLFTKAGRIRNALNGSRGGYSHAGGFVWDGGVFVGAGNGTFTISHAPGFTIRNSTMHGWADATDDGQAIEINASGGAHTPGVFSIHIVDNTFLGVTGQRANSNDEAVQYDFSWDGSGGDAPFDATMTHNVEIARNTFHRVDESGDWQFALCAIGGHRGSAGEPAERHNGFLIADNAIHGAVGATANVSPDKGGIALWNVRDVVIRNNAFFGATATRLISAWDANPDRALNDATMNIAISGTTHNGRAVTVTMPSSNTTGG